LNPRQAGQVLDSLKEESGNIRRTIQDLKDQEADLFFHPPAETVEESAEDIGVNEEQIVKTLVFSTETGYVAVLCPGHTSVDESKLEANLDSSVDLASPQEVQEQTGYIVGGVAPFDLDIPVLAEEDITERETVKPSAGSRCAGVELSSDTLIQVTEAETADISR